ncbi:MAG: hypothetical protein ACFB2Z_08720 [Maricaulaceae bacterium]
MTVDLGAVAASTGIGLVAGSIAAGTAAISAVALGPLIVVVSVAFVTSLGLSYLAEKLKLTERLTTTIDAAIAKALERVEQRKRTWYPWAKDVTIEVFDYLIEFFVDCVADQFRHAARQYFSRHRWLIFQ